MSGLLSFVGGLLGFVGGLLGIFNSVGETLNLTIRKFPDLCQKKCAYIFPVSGAHELRLADQQKLRLAQIELRPA